MILRPLDGSQYVHSLGPKKSCASAVLSNVDLQMATNAVGKSQNRPQERLVSLPVSANCNK